MSIQRTNGLIQKSSDLERIINNGTYGFDALYGIQAGSEYYVAMCPIKIIPELFIFDDHNLPPELRAQRTLRNSRIPEIKNYILNNPDNYIFSSLTSSVDGVMKFIPSPHLGPDGKQGRLYIDTNSRLLINDGQHRGKAIEEALKERPKLGHETISVVFFQDRGLKKSQQMFSDLNKNAVKPTKSLNILYDQRDKFSQFVVDITSSQIEIFKGRVDMENTTISNRSKKVFTLNGITDATMRLLGNRKLKKITAEQKNTVIEFWERISKIIPEWQLLLKGDIEPIIIRKKYVHGNTNMLNSLGVAGNVLLKECPRDWKNKIVKLRNVDWTRENPEWDGVLLQGGRMVKTTMGIELGANLLLRKCGIKLSNYRLSFEEKKEK